MKMISREALLAGILFSGLAGEALAANRGGNGGDIFEIDLSKRIKKIGTFINSSVGRTLFSNLNTIAVEELSLAVDINLTSDLIFDKFEVERSCVNFPEKNTIVCQSNKLEGQSQDVLDVILAHELFGLIGLETGYSDNPSDYPLSFKLINYTELIDSTKLNEVDLYPEYIGLDNNSYGVTYVNRKTGESLRMICLNDNVPVNRCRNYSVVRSAGEYQAPLIREDVSITPDELSKFDVKNIQFDGSGFRHGENSKLHKFKWDKADVVLPRYMDCLDFETTRFGLGLTEFMVDNVPYDAYCDEIPQIVAYSLVPIYGIPLLVGLAVDIPTEILRQSVNAGLGVLEAAVYYPFEAIVKRIQKIPYHKAKRRHERSLEDVERLLNISNDLTLINQVQKVNDLDFQMLILNTTELLSPSKE